jgi:hypothetical protein
MAGTNPRNDPFYAGNLNDDAATYAANKVEEKYWTGGTRTPYYGSGGEESLTASDLVAQTDALIAYLEADDYEVVE